MRRYDLITPEGTRDLLFEECLARRTVENKLTALFRSFGYSEVVTPGMEFYELFHGTSRTFRQESLFKLTDAKNRLVILRPDNTVPIARLASTRLKDEDLPLRLYYDQLVFENHALLKGRSNEIMQAGIELIGGENTKRADYEALCIAVDALSCWGKDFRLEIGHIGYFKELVRKLNIDSRTEEEIRLLINAKNYPALNDLLDGIADNEITDTLKKLPGLFGGEDVFEKAAALYTDEKIKSILDNVKVVYERLASLGYKDKIIVDLGIVRHTDYYTGIVFKGYLTGIGDSILKGGRYDGLLSEFGRECPAVGFGVNCDAIATYICKLGEAPTPKTPDCMIYGEKGHVVEALAYAQTLVREGMTVENSLFSNLEDTKKNAADKGIHKIFIVGDEITHIEV
ncbi:ATP phosphoribosyltransferase regulatory subunit [Ruminococcus sp. YE71]|uniref:ATP phosphoribosyltransferase regulatory subunit n=1 Tax=unclassified Ruminococcus TaxID=2608920 RepID=UPI00088D2D6E|nr:MULTISPECIES: ATP phosphoribosyltransferase regulatory subunit [unclassified Ruminococcus]SDA20922.1 ATP phosphoribosyltransferase regulatory subunit [Ruminococcus sp. YE78]SFW33348.1 ATP phosphoribosyltransferase regulatory subunit [Ruminococcus sp. YE71]